ncbi:hypothetical protein BW897_11020 [Bacillus cereus]|uniref:RiboL-PSP-HEPN domain-containing protein n=1 Tax=Bacillus cereus TaxID=1396 RepID=A0A1S9TRG7_BACCE|nr:hypothetical protein [Bacillus cereus]OOR12636.1 hypothetical protein BW897_11020 [Bacillus cereus]
MQMNKQRNDDGSSQDTYESIKIRGNIAARVGDQSLEEYVGLHYSSDVKECLDILDIGYHVTAVGVLGRALEQCTKEYCESAIKNKKAFKLNDPNLSISSIRNKFWGIEGSQDDRLKLLNQQTLIKKGGHKFQLKKKLLKNEYYFVLDSIKNARNNAFHGCSEEEFREIQSKSRVLIEWGLNILITLIGEIKKNRS